MNNNKVEVRFPFRPRIMTLVLKEATAEELVVITETTRDYFVASYHDESSYSAMATRLSGLLRQMLRGDDDLLASDAPWKKVDHEALCEEHKVASFTSFGSIVFRQVPTF